MNRLAKFISIISHPIFLPTWMFAIFVASGFNNLSHINIHWTILVIFVTTAIIPALFLLVLKKLNVIKSFYMERREDRFIPLLLMIIFLYTISYFFRDIRALGIYNFYILVNIIICTIAFWINMYWKISLHTLGWGVFSATLFILTTFSAKIYLPYFITSIIASGIVAAARLYLKSHNESQIYVGFIVGFITTLVIYYTIGN